MRLAQIIGAISSATCVVTIDPNNGARSFPYSSQSPAPNDTGPIVDTKREGKRAKRRRIARSPKKLELCIDCGQPATKPSPILNRMCQCRDDLSG